MDELLHEIHEATRNINRRSGNVDRDIDRIVDKSNELLRQIQALDFSENTPGTINAIRQKLQRIQQATRGKLQEPRLAVVNNLFGQLYNALSPNRLANAISRLGTVGASALARSQATRTRGLAPNAWVTAPVNTRGGRRTRRRRSKLYL